MFLLSCTELLFRRDQMTPPQSLCSRPCSRSQAKKYLEGEACCWTCIECIHYQVRTHRVPSLSLCIDYISSQLALWCRLLSRVLFLCTKKKSAKFRARMRIVSRDDRMFGGGHFSRSNLLSRFFPFISKQKREWPSPHMLSKEKSILNNRASTPTYSTTAAARRPCCFYPGWHSRGSQEALLLFALEWSFYYPVHPFYLMVDLRLLWWPPRGNNKHQIN